MVDKQGFFSKKKNESKKKKGIFSRFRNKNESQIESEPDISDADEPDSVECTSSGVNGSYYVTTPV